MAGVKVCAKLTEHKSASWMFDRCLPSRHADKVPQSIKAQRLSLLKSYSRCAVVLSPDVPFPLNFSDDLIKPPRCEPASKVGNFCRKLVEKWIFKVMWAKHIDGDGVLAT